MLARTSPPDATTLANRPTATLRPLASAPPQEAAAPATPVDMTVPPSLFAGLAAGGCLLLVVVAVVVGAVVAVRMRGPKLSGSTRVKAKAVLPVHNPLENGQNQDQQHQVEPEANHYSWKTAEQVLGQAVGYTAPAGAIPFDKIPNLQHVCMRALDLNLCRGCVWEPVGNECYECAVPSECTAVCPPVLRPHATPLATMRL